MTLTLGSLFAGIGGFDLAAEHYGWTTLWFVEIDPSCRHWLGEHFPSRPIYGDITQLDFTEVERVDILCGGFPCQPSSAAGKRLGTADDRWLWPEFARAIGTLRPRYVVAENVPGLVSVNGGRAFAEVLRDLASLGYDAEWDRLSAGDVGSPQERERAWIVAYAGRSGSHERVDRRETGRARQQSVFADTLDGGEVVGHGDNGRREQRDAGERNGAVVSAGLVPVGDASSSRREGSEPEREAGRAGLTDERGGVGDTDRERQRQRGESKRPQLESAQRAIAHRSSASPWRDAVPVRGADGTVRLIPREAAERGPEPEVRALAHGIPHHLVRQRSTSLWPVTQREPGRVARLKAIGNAVVPQCVIEGPFRVIAEMEAAS